MYIKKIIKIFVIVFLPFCIQLFASGRNKTRTVKEVVVERPTSKTPYGTPSFKRNRKALRQQCDD